MSSLKEYQQKRHFQKTPEPAGKDLPPHPVGNSFVVQKHDATRLHYDFRLEIDGVLKSWAVPKGPSLNPADKRLAMETEDHPLEYGGFEGVIPEGNYGAGPVMVWDNGSYEVEGDLQASRQYDRGEIKFSLQGQKLRGSFVLVKLKSSNQRGGEKGKPWLLIKHNDAAVDPGWDVNEHDGSVLTGRSIKEIEEGLPAGGASSATVELSSQPEALENARRAKMPAQLTPMLATLATTPFSNPEWLFEIKWDGIRAVGWIRDHNLELRSRTHRVITHAYPELSGLPAKLRAEEALVDGEIVVLDSEGRSSFERLQSRMNVASAPSSALKREAPVIYYLFDLLYLDGYDLREAPMVERKQLLQQILQPGDPFRYADHVLEKGKELFDLARAQGLEGMIAKQLRSPYESKRSTCWLKFKITHDLDTVIGGWTAPRGSREHFGALLAGLYQGKNLQFVGGVGTGFTEKTQRQVFDQLKGVRSEKCPFTAVPETKEEAFWVEPRLVARVKYSNWTQEPRLRAPVFLGLRADLDPKDCRFETEATPLAGSPEAEPAVVSRQKGVGSSSLKAAVGSGLEAVGSGTERLGSGGVTGTILTGKLVEKELFEGKGENANIEIDGQVLKLSNLNKVYFPESKYTKRDLLAYYYRICEYILPFLKDRPLVLRRYPNGIADESFFQKDAGQAAPTWMKTVKIDSEDKKKPINYFLADNRAALLYLTNLGCIDHNPWSSRTDDLEHPDYFFFDLDPSEGTGFETVLAVARAVYDLLLKFHLNVYLKTSGATGLHMYIPIERRYTFEDVRNFADIVGRLVAGRDPKHVTQERSVEKRPQGTVLIDAYQNSSGRPLASVYSVRAFPGAPVSTPISSTELRANLRPERLNIRSVFDRLKKHGDLWSGFWEKRQGLEQAVELLGKEIAP